MSLWPHRELRIVLSPHRVALLPAPRGPGLRGGARTVRGRHDVDVPEGGDAQPWQAALSTLGATLPLVATRGMAATVVLSNRLVRYVLVPWRAGLADGEEDLAYARHCFTGVYGKAALQWELRLGNGVPELPRLACAIDSELLAALRGVFERAGIALRSVSPHLMVAFNGARRSFQQGGAWLALLEPGHLCLAFLHDGHWASVRSHRIGARWQDELPVHVERAALFVDAAEGAQDVHVGVLEGADLVLPAARPWRFHALAPAAAGPAAMAQA